MYEWTIQKLKNCSDPLKFLEAVYLLLIYGTAVQAQKIVMFNAFSWAKKNSLVGVRFLDRWQWKRDVAKKSSIFKETHQKISVPLAMSTNLRKKSFKLFKNPEKKKSWAAQDRPEKNSAKCCSKRRDSESWTDIDRQNQQLRHEIWTVRAR